MKSPCKECQRRTLGCHNVDTCTEWRDYVETKKKAYAAKMETAKQGNDWIQHMRRHGRMIPRR